MSPRDGGGGAAARLAERAAFAAGARAIGTTALGTFSWGLVTGVALVKGGLTPPQALGMVALVYSGTAQLAALPLLTAGVPVVAIWATALLALGWMTTDTGLAAYYGRSPVGHAPSDGGEPPRLRTARFLGTNATVYGGWTVGSVAGVAAAGLIPDSPRIAFVGVLAILALVGPMLSAAPTVAAAGEAAVVAVLGRDWPWRTGTFAAIAVGIVAAVALSARGAERAR